MLKDTAAHITDLLSLHVYVDQEKMQVTKIIHFHVDIKKKTTESSTKFTLNKSNGMKTERRKTTYLYYFSVF